MRFKKRPQLPGAGRTRAGHHHGSHTPTSPGTILLGKMAYHSKQIRRECTKAKDQLRSYCLIYILCIQGKLTQADTAMARWLVFAYTHHDLPLDYRVFLPTLEKLHYTLLNNLFHQEEVRYKNMNGRYRKDYVFYQFNFMIAYYYSDEYLY